MLMAFAFQPVILYASIGFGGILVCARLLLQWALRD
jgi:hypothetical protein